MVQIIKRISIWFVILLCTPFCSGCSLQEETVIDSTTTRIIENTVTEIPDEDNVSEEGRNIDEKVEMPESYINKYIDLSDDTEVEGYEWMQYDDEQVLRVKIQYKEVPLNNYQHKEDYFLFIDQDETVTKTLVVDYEDKGIHIRLNEGTECINNHYLGEGCSFNAYFEDVTFDGKKDLIISVGNSRHAEYHCAYICEDDGFRYEKTFEHIPSYEISKDEKIICGSDTDGMGLFFDTTYEYINREFVLIESNEYTISE